MKKLILTTATMLSTVLVLASSPAIALSLPHGKAGTVEKGHTYADKLYGFGWVIANPDGSAVAHALFSNSRKWDGGKKVSLLVRVMAGDEILHAARFTQSLNDPVFKGTIEKHQAQNFSLTPEQWAKVTEIKYDFSQQMTAAECDFFKQKAMENEHIYYNPTVLGCNP